MEKILNFCEISGETVKEFKGIRKYIATGDVIDNQILSSKDVTYTNKPSRANQNVHIGDVLFAKMKETLKVIVIDKSNVNNIFSTGFFVIKPKENVESKFLYWLFNSNKFNNQKNKYCKGATQKALNNDGLSKISIDKFPELKEQIKIVKKLDKVQEIINIRKKQIEELNKLVKSYYEAMFGKNKYNIKKLKDICDRITDGTHKTPEYKSEGITFISAKNIVKEKIDFSDVKYISLKEYKNIQKRCNTERGDILLSKSGSIGTPVILEVDIPIGLFESLAVIKYYREKINGVFLCEQLKSFEVQKQFKNGIKGISIKHLHLNVIGNINIIVPPIELQNHFAEVIKKIYKQKLEIQNNLEKMKKLQEILMNKYFS